MSAATNYEFKTFNTAFFAQELNAGRNGYDNYKFNNENLQLLGAEIVNNNLIGKLGIDLTIADTNSISITFIKNMMQNFSEKDTLGAGTFQAPKLAKITADWNKPLSASIGFYKADLDRGLPDVLSEKVNWLIQQFARETEKEAWRQLEKHLEANTSQITETVDLVAENDKNKVYEKVVSLATKLTQLENEADAIYGIPKDKIVIFVKPAIADKLAQLGIVGNAAEKYYAGGQYSMATVAGYSVCANPYLDKFDVVVGTTFTAASAIRTIALNYERLVPSNDSGLYFEAQNIFKIINPSALLAIKTSKPLNLKNSGIITTPLKA
ncbi:hypothetical protein [Mycoplasmopsis meleagridis]|uniref:hypothetical protein n=1 Tax=Mycoplasmopsis meleagridis TaxID=29561 RepID=UPI00073D3874|nr:hypothetical protein [Mycoplasmopsis meleagridis]KUH47512.1 hypothetical protein ASB56_00025 [Mycoplasmopsis meleagridis]